MSKDKGPVAAINSDEREVRELMERRDARQKAFAEWMREEGSEILDVLGGMVLEMPPGYAKGRLALVFWNAFKAGERHGRAQLDAILSHGRREA